MTAEKIPSAYAFRGVTARCFQGFQRPVGGVSERFIKYLLKRRSKCVENRRKKPGCEGFNHSLPHPVF